MKMNSVYPKDLNIENLDAMSFWKLVNGEWRSEFDLIIDDKDYFQVWQNNKTGRYYYVDIEEFDDFFELERIGLLEYDMKNTRMKPESRLALALDCSVCGDAFPADDKGRFMWFNKKRPVAGLVSKGFYSSEIVQKKLKGLEPDDMVPGTLLDNYLIIGDGVCTAYIVRPMTTQSSCYEILEGPEDEIRSIWDRLKSETDKIINS